MFFKVFMDLKVVEDFIVKLENVLDIYEVYFVEYKYLVGEFVSIVDFVYLFFGWFCFNVIGKYE